MNSTDVPEKPVELSSESINCPLCDYDLRGLTEPRCPECGHRFDWEELRQHAREKHPFLFESYPDRNAWSFGKTLLAGWRPARFFTVLKPHERIRPLRLLLYWMLTSALLVVLSLPVFVRQVLAVHTRLAEQGMVVVRMYQQMPPNDPMYKAIITSYGSMAAYAAQVTHPSWRLSVIQSMRMQPYQMPIEPLLIALLAWPWATLAALMLCRASLKQARVRSSHVLRCVIYSCDAAMLFGAALALLPPNNLYEAMESLPRPIARFIAFPFLLPVFAIAVIFGGYVAYRLWQAHKRYLRLPHALPMALASQVIVGLCLLVYAMRAMGW